MWLADKFAEIEQHRSQPASPAGSPKRVPASLMMTSASNDKPRSSSTTSGAGVAMEHDGKESSSKDESRDRDKEVKQVDLSRALLTSVATTNISTLQQGLSKQTAYWSGVAWISSALEKRIEGIQDVDLVGVTEKLASFVSLPDAGLVGRSEDEVGETPRGNGAQTPATNTHGGFTGLEHLDFGECCSDPPDASRLHSCPSIHHRVLAYQSRRSPLNPLRRP